MNQRRHPAWNVVELVVYLGGLWLLTHPGRMEELGDRLAQFRGRVRLQVEAWDTLAQIRSLPEE